MRKQRSHVEFTSNISSPPTHFTLFPLLPTEIRIKIWSIVCHQPRNVDIWARSLGGSIGTTLHPFIPFRYASHSSVPIILQTTRESRQIGLQFYHLEFGTFHENEVFRFQTPPQIYINFAVDRICDLSGSYLTTPQICEYFIAKCRDNGTRSLALRLNSMLDGDSEPLLGYQDRPLWASPTLEEVILFVSPANLDVKGDIDFTEIKDFSRIDDESFILLDRARTLLWRRVREHWNGRSPTQEEIKLRPRVRYACINLDGSKQ